MAIRLAVEDVNTQKIIPGINMSLVLRDSQDPSLLTATGGAAAIAGVGSLISAKVSGVIGDIRSDLTSYEALMTSSVGISQCSFASGSTTLSDVETYPYFFRTIPTILTALDAILELIKHVGWKRIMLIYDIEYLGWAGREYFTSKARSMGIYSLANQPLTTAGVPFDPTFGFLKDTIQSTASRVQILLATARLQRDVLREMRDSGYMGPEYAWVTTNDLAEHYGMMEPQVEGYNGLIMLDNVWDLRGYQPFDSFVSRWERLNITEYPGAGDLEIENDEGMAYSCVMMLAHVCRELVRHKLAHKPSLQTDQDVLREIMSGYHPSDIEVIKYFQTRTYEGPAGPITLDENGDRKYGLFDAFSLQDGKSIPFAYIADNKYIAIRDPPFKKSHPTLPKDAPPWAIQNPTWTNARGIVYGILCSIGILLTLLSAFLVYFLRDNIIIKAASPTFCLCELLGILLVFVWCIMMVGVPVTATCVTQSLLLSIGITLLAGSLTIKNYRIYRIFNSVNVANQAFQTRLLLQICGTFFTNLLALSVLFYPKFWKIWKAYQRSRHQSLDGHWQPGHHHRSHHRLRRPDDMTTGISSRCLMGINTPAFGNIPDAVAPDAVATNGVVDEMPSKRRASTGAKAIAVTDSSSSTAREVPLKGKQRERPLKRGLSSNSSLGDGPPSVNLVDWWMNASVPIQRIASSTLSAQGGTGGTDNRLDEQLLRGTFMNERDFQETLRRRSVERERGSGGEGSLRTLPVRPSHVTFMPSTTDPQVFDVEPSQPGPPEVTREGVDSDIPTELDAYAGRFASFLSHWSMATLILIPEAHAFVAVDCTDGRSRSHLILSMTQVVVENEPTIRVVTCHSGTLLIRFRNQARLDSWLKVFSPQDLAALMPTSTPGSSLASTINDNTERYENLCNVPTPSSILARGNNHHPVATPRHSPSVHGREGTANGKMPRLSEQSSPEMSEVDRRPTITTTNAPVLEDVVKDTGVGMRTESEALPGLDQTQSPHQGQQPQTWNHGSQGAEQEIMVSASAPVIEAPVARQARPSVSASTAFSESIQGNTDVEVNDNGNDDDDDDLYDPEFGIGGTGRRRFHSRSSISNMSRFNSSANRSGSIAVPAIRLTKSANGSPSMPPPGTIPSPAVISAAAAAVSAGWSECDALSAAMADPNGEFLTALQADKSDNTLRGFDQGTLLHSRSADNIAGTGNGKANSSSKRHSLSPFSLFGGQQSRRQSTVEGDHHRRNSSGRSHSHSPRLHHRKENHLQLHPLLMMTAEAEIKSPSPHTQDGVLPKTSATGSRIETRIRGDPKENST
ncbi:hypothetical protein BGZ68_005667 [Mortierella alpina]|nr:hypothetical protein BGZ68_005667 [Mortierella alpina]